MKTKSDVFRLFCEALQEWGGGGADSRTTKIKRWFSLYHHMIRPEVKLRSSMIILRSVELLKYICGHVEKWFGLFRVIVMDHHIVKYPMLAFRIFLFR